MPQNLQLTILNERGRIWTLVAGGGASVIFADTIVEKSNVEDLANYGEYSGAPNEEQVKYLRDPVDNFLNSYLTIDMQ
jgi:succinyl-CoA synthetase beta subunit